MGGLVTSSQQVQLVENFLNFYNIVMEDWLFKINEEKQNLFYNIFSKVKFTVIESA